MSLRRGGVLAAALLALAGVPGDARADIIKKLAGSAAQGVVEKVQPAIAATLADVDRRIERHEDRIGSIASKVDADAGKRLEQVDHIVEARILQAKVEASDLTNQALGRVDQMVQRADEISEKRVKELDQLTKSALAGANATIEARIADVGREVDRALERADGVIAARIEQVDELAGRRLGNLDVIASKQRIALEQTAVRVAVLVGLVVFIVFVMRRLWGAYQEMTKDEPDRGPPLETRRWRARGRARTWMFVKGLGAPFIGHLAVAAVASGLLFVLYDRLPLGAKNEAAELTHTHQRELEESLERFEFARVRFHASQLEYLGPENATYYRALAAKGDLLRDLFARPTLWATDTGIAELTERLRGVRRLLGRTPDPDVLAVEGMLKWQTGASRRDEHEAVSLFARALRLRPRGFALAPLARAYIETFLRTPYIDGDAGYGRDAETLQDLRAALENAPPDDDDHPLATNLKLLRLMQEVNADSTAAYLRMVEGHARLTKLARAGAPAADRQQARDERTRYAQKVVEAWTRFDSKLADTPEFAANPAVLGVFRLDDALFSRAQWFVKYPNTDEIAPLLAPEAEAPAKAEGPARLDQLAKAKEKPAEKPPELKVRIALAPPRVVWARRYRSLIDGPARLILELQEAERFRVREREARDFELALAAAEADPGKKAGAALAAAKLGFYVGDPEERRPYAREIVPALESKVGGARALHVDEKGQGADEKALTEALLARGVRLL